MAHHLDFNTETGLASMAYVGEAPWHGLGQKMPEGASLDDWLKAGQMDWQYDAKPVLFQATPESDLETYDDSVVITRSDTGRALSVVGKRYKLVQPQEILQFFKSLVEKEGFTIETVGSLKEGRRIWAMARTNIENAVLGSDMIKGYLLLITSCDGTIATTAKFVATRVVCWNTQNVALNHESGQAVKVRHNTFFDPSKVKTELGLEGARAFGDFIANMRGLTKVKISDKDAESLLVTSILPKPIEGADPKEGKAFQKIMALFNGGQKGFDLPGVQGTAWGLMNAVSEYADHHARARNNEFRFSSAQFGPGAYLKERAESALVALT